MRRWIYTYEYVQGEPLALEQRLLEDLPALLRQALGAVEGETSVDGSFVVDVPGGIASVDVAKRVRVHTGVAHRSGNRVLVPIQWQAEPASHVFPAFGGHFELEPLSATQAQLSLVGSYRAPLGPVGALMDVAGLHRIAHRTAEQVLRGVARQLTKRPTAKPAPSRSRRWPLRVRDVMTPDPLVLDPTLPVKSAALLLFYAGVSGAPVVAEDGTLVGVLSERDLLAKEAPERFGFGKAVTEDRRRREARTVQEACTTPAVVTVPDARLADAALELLDHDISRLVVIDQGRVVGIISRHDVLAALVRDDADLYAAVEDMLGELGEDPVSAEVSWGKVTLSGSVERRSGHAAVVTAVRNIDGVMGVDADELTWKHDDVVPFIAVP